MCFPSFASSLNLNLRSYLAVSPASPLPLVTLTSTPCLLQISGDEFFASVAQDILLYVSRDLSDPVGCSLGWAKGSHLPCSGTWLGAAFPSLPSQLSSVWGTAVARWPDCQPSSDGELAEGAVPVTGGSLCCSYPRLEVSTVRKMLIPTRPLHLKRSEKELSVCGQLRKFGLSFLTLSKGPQRGRPWEMSSCTTTG